MKIKPVSRPNIRKTIVMGKNKRNSGSVFHSGSGGATLNGSSMGVKDVSDTISSQC